MANTVYPLGKEKLLGAATPIDLDSDNIKVSAMNATHTYSAAHEFYSDVSANVIQDSANIGSVTLTSGTFDAANLNPAFTGVTTNIDSLVIWKDTGTPSTSPLIAHLDTGTGFPLTQDGGNVDVNWNGSGIFSI